MAKFTIQNKGLLTIVIAYFFSMYYAYSQDPHFSQFYTAPLTQNPGLAGAVYDKQANLNYKNQWSSVANPYTTIAASYDMKFVKKRIVKGYWAGGLSLFKDDAGTANLRTVTVNLTAAYHIKLNQHNSLGAGLQGGFAQRSISLGALQWGSQYNGYAYDPGIPSNEPINNATRFIGDCAMGLVWSFSNNTNVVKINGNHILKWNIGVSAFHLNRPNLSFINTSDPLNMKFVVHGDGVISIPNTMFAFAPGFMLYSQGPTSEILYGSLIRYSVQQNSKYTGFAKGAAVSLGAFHRWADAFALVLQLEVSGYRLGMSYDLNASELRTVTKGMGGMEISLSYVTYDPFMNSRKR
jgi:type IX secretion system PorP/SprF family membrane protein